MIRTGSLQYVLETACGEMLYMGRRLKCVRRETEIVGFVGDARRKEIIGGENDGGRECVGV